MGLETLRDSVKFTRDSTFVDALGPRDAIEMKPKSNRYIFPENQKKLFLPANLGRVG